MITSLLLYLAVGAVAGVLAGLLGVGGGLVIVPMLNFAFALEHIPDQFIQHLALGTSLGSIMFTSVSSFRAHHKRGAVLWREVVFRITPGIITGTLLGSWVAAGLSTSFLKGFFVCFLYWVAAQMLLNLKPKASRELPGSGGMFGMGNVIGVVSSLVGISGGTLSVSFTAWCIEPRCTASRTTAAIGFPIAVAGTVGYIVNGLAVAGLPENTFGFIHVPALIGIVGASVFTAPLGARLAHSLPVARLKRIFAVLLLVMGTRMLWGLL